MPDRISPTQPERAAEKPQQSLGSRVKEAFEQGVEAIVEALGSLIEPEPQPIPVSRGGARRRPPRTDHRFR